MATLNARLALAGMAAMLAASARDLPAAFQEEIPPPPTPTQRAKWKAQRGYPQTGTGKRQGARLARQIRWIVCRAPNQGLHIKHAGRWWNRDDPNLDRDVRAAYINAELQKRLAERKEAA